MANPSGILNGTSGVLLREGVVICGATSNGSSINRTLVESTNKCSEEFRTIIPNSGTVTYDHTFDGFWSEDAAFEQVVEDWKTGATANYTFVYGDSGKEDDFVAIVESISNGYEIDAPVSSSFVLKSTDDFDLNESGPEDRTDYYYDFSGSGATLGREIIDIDDDFSIKFSLLGAIPTTGHIVSQASGGPSSNSLLELRLVGGDFRFLFGGTDNAPVITATTGDWEFRLIGTNLRILKDTVEVYNNTISRGSNEDGAVTAVGMNAAGGSSYDGIIYNVEFEALNGAPLVASRYYIDDNSSTLLDLEGVQNGTISVGYNPANWSQIP